MRRGLDPMEMVFGRRIKCPACGQPLRGNRQDGYSCGPCGLKVEPESRGRDILGWYVRLLVYRIEKEERAQGQPLRV